MEKNQSILALLLIVLLVLLMQFNSNQLHERDLQIHNLEAKIERDSLMYEIQLRDAKIDSISRRELNWENIEYWMEEFGVKHKEIAMRQVYLETGNLTSTICLENNNLFGMRQARVRPNVAAGTKRSHAYYDDFILSIIDYALWQENMYNGQKDYYAFLRSVGYAECKSYIQKLRYIEENIDLV